MGREDAQELADLTPGNRTFSSKSKGSKHLFQGQVFNTESQIDLTFLNHRSRTRKAALQEPWYYFLSKLFPGTPPKEKSSSLKEKGDIFPPNFIQSDKLETPLSISVAWPQMGAQPWMNICLWCKGHGSSPWDHWWETSELVPEPFLYALSTRKWEFCSTHPSEANRRQRILPFKRPCTQAEQQLSFRYIFKLSSLLPDPASQITTQLWTHAESLTQTAKPV